MTTEWTEPDPAPSATVIYGPRGEKLREFKDVSEIGFKSPGNAETP